MTCDTSILTVNPGSDWQLRATLTDDAGPVDLSGGWVASIYDVTGVLGAAPAAAIIDAAAGLVEQSGTWQPGWPLTGEVLGTFRYRLVRGGEEIGSWPVTVVVNGATAEVRLARGSDLTVELVWPDDRMGLDLTGDVVEVINISAGLAGLVSVEVTDPVTRTIRWHIEGDPAMPQGDLGTFQLRRSTGGLHRRTLPPIRIICA